MPDVYQIFPAIGIARVGNSEEYYLAPETPGGLPILNNGEPFAWPPVNLYPLENYPDPLYPDTPNTINRLGEAHTDAQGRLTVVGGFGRSGSSVNPPSIKDYANNDHWWDDTSDGPISATIVSSSIVVNKFPLTLPGY